MYLQIQDTTSADNDTHPTNRMDTIKKVKSPYHMTNTAGNDFYSLYSICILHFIPFPSTTPSCNNDAILLPALPKGKAYACQEEAAETTTAGHGSEGETSLSASSTRSS